MPTGSTFSLYQSSSSWFVWLPRNSGTARQVNIFTTWPELDCAYHRTISFPDPHHLYHCWGLIALYSRHWTRTTVPQKEQAEMLKVVNQMLAKRSAGEATHGGDQFLRPHAL